MTIHYICFVSFLNNGTSGIAEINRRIMNDIASYRTILDETYNGNLFKFLVKGFDEVEDGVWSVLENNGEWSKKMVGSNRPNRFLPSNCADTEWDELTEDIFELTYSFYEGSNIWNRATIETKLESLVQELITKKNPNGSVKFKGAGSLAVQHFVHLSSMLGIIPLYCATYGHIYSESLGPAKFIKLVQGDQSKLPGEYNKILKSVHSDFKSIWGEMITLVLLENIFCELSRTYNETCAAIRKQRKQNNEQNDDEIPFEVVMDPTKFVASKKHDMIFENEATGTVQNFYNLSLTTGKSNSLRPSLRMRHSKNTLEGAPTNECIWTLTNWDGKSENLIDWSDDHSTWNLDSTYLKFNKIDAQTLFPTK